MSGTKTAYAAGQETGRAGLPYANPYSHHVVGDNAHRYCEGYLSGTREFNRGIRPRSFAQNTDQTYALSVWRDSEPTHKSKMSKDRVVFVIKAYYFQQTNHCDFQCVLSKAFGMSADDIGKLRARALHTAIDTRVVCRPSQFARFLIWRNEAGFQNMFKELDVFLVRAETITQYCAWDVDVSRNPA